MSKKTSTIISFVAMIVSVVSAIISAYCYYTMPVLY